MIEAREIRVGVVGLGFGAQVHVPAFAGLPGCRVAALAGRDLAKAQKAADERGVEQAFGGWERMLGEARLDAVSLAVPPALQPVIARAAAERGLAVFMEKPAGAEVQQVRELLEVFTRHGTTSAVNFLFPEVPAWQAARQWVLRQPARSLRQATLTWYVETYAERHQTDSWKRRVSDGGGAIHNFVSHSAYYLEWLLGPIHRLQARLFAANGRDESRVAAWLELADGLLVELSVATDCPFGSGHRLELYGRDGALILHNPGSDYVNGFTLQTPSRGGDPADSPTPAPTPGGDGRVWATASIARRFLEHVRRGGSPTPSLVQGLRVQAILDALRRSHAAGQPVEIAP